jgi:hypothetical protein
VTTVILFIVLILVLGPILYWIFRGITGGFRKQL